MPLYFIAHADDQDFWLEGNYYGCVIINAVDYEVARAFCDDKKDMLPTEINDSELKNFSDDMRKACAALPEYTLEIVDTERRQLDEIFARRHLPDQGLPF